MKHKYKVIFLLVLLFICGLGFFFLRPSDDTPASNQPISDQTSSSETISLPGYSSITFAANTTDQEQTFSNPKENNCYIKVSILLSDGNLLWHSDLIAPGNSSDAVQLTTALSEGVYKESILKYECYTMDNSLTQLNGAQSTITLVVE